MGRFGATLPQTCLPREYRIENLFFHIEIFQLVTEEMQSCEKEELEKKSMINLPFKINVSTALVKAY